MPLSARYVIAPLGYEFAITDDEADVHAQANPPSLVTEGGARCVC